MPFILIFYYNCWNLFFLKFCSSNNSYLLKFILMLCILKLFDGHKDKKIFVFFCVSIINLLWRVVVSSYDG